MWTQPRRLCEIDGCNRTHNAKGLCNVHYQAKYARTLKQQLAEKDAEIAALHAHAQRLTAAVMLLMWDAHQTYGNTTGWRGGIGGQALTTTCGVIDPAPDQLWAQCDLPTKPARDYVNAYPFDLDTTKDSLKVELLAMLKKKDT